MWEVTEKKKTTTKKTKHASKVDGGSLKDECIVLYYVCMYYWVCYAYSTTDSESVSLQNPLHKIYSKSITKNIWGFSFFFCFSWIWWPVLLFGLPLQLICQMNNHYFNRSYSKALQLQKTWYDIQHLLHLYNVIQQCIESSDLNL